MTWEGRCEKILQILDHPPVVEIGNLAPSHAALYAKIETFNPLGPVNHRLAPVA